MNVCMRERVCAYVCLNSNITTYILYIYIYTKYVYAN